MSHAPVQVNSHPPLQLFPHAALQASPQVAAQLFVHCPLHCPVHDVEQPFLQPPVHDVEQPVLQSPVQVVEQSFSQFAVHVVEQSLSQESLHDVEHSLVHSSAHELEQVLLQPSHPVEEFALLFSQFSAQTLEHESEQLFVQSVQPPALFIGSSSPQLNKKEGRDIAAMNGNVFCAVRLKNSRLLRSSSFCFFIFIVFDEC